MASGVLSGSNAPVTCRSVVGRGQLLLSTSGYSRTTLSGTREQAKREITEYIEIFYNRIRKQARPGHLSPAAFSQQYHAMQMAA